MDLILLVVVLWCVGMGGFYLPVKGRQLSIKDNWIAGIIYYSTFSYLAFIAIRSVYDISYYFNPIIILYYFLMTLFSVMFYRFVRTYRFPKVAIRRFGHLDALYADYRYIFSKMTAVFYQEILAIALFIGFIQLNLIPDFLLPIAFAGFIGFLHLPLIYFGGCLLYTSPSPRDGATSRMPSSA